MTISLAFLGWPQFIYLSILALRLVHLINKWGQPRKPVNAPYGFVDLTSMAIFVALLYWGGFFG